MNKVPVLFLIYNREELSVKSFECISEYKPDRLYIAADGYKPDKNDEELCLKTRQVVLDRITWECEVKLLFRNKNLGCTKAVTEAITWFFENEFYGAIIEDDVVVSLDFFRMCEVLLTKYESSDRIMQITSQNIGSAISESNTYTFQIKPFIWGWATWRRAWSRYMDMEMIGYPSFHFVRMLKGYGLFQTIMMYRYWSKAWRNKDNTSWDSFWHFSAVSNNLLCICPKVNLSLNIGCSFGGAHYKKGSVDPYSNLKIGSLQFPIVHPQTIDLDKEQLKADKAEFLRIRLHGLKNMLLKHFQIC